MGRPRRHSKNGLTTRETATKELRRILSEVDAGIVRPSGDQVTFHDQATAWLRTKRVAEISRSAYERDLRLHVLPFLGDRRLQKITPTMLAGLYRTLEAGGRLTAHGKPSSALGPAAVRRVHVIIQAVLETAVQDNLLVRNAAKHPRANPPTDKQVRDARKPTTVWTARQLAEFLAWSREHEHHWAMYEFFARTGLRAAEIAGLIWSDLSFAGPTPYIAIQRSRSRVYREGCGAVTIERGTKSGRERTLFVDREVVTAARAHRDAQGERYGLGAIQRDAHVFTKFDGTPILGKNAWYHFTEAIKRYVRATGTPLPHIGPHGLRHTHATILLEAGTNPKAIQERLDHSSIATTFDTYAHVPIGTDRAVAASFAKALENATHVESEGRTAADGATEYDW